MSDVAQSQVSHGHGHDGETRRDFLTLTATALGVVGAAAAIWPFIDSLNPAADTLALSTTEVDLSPEGDAHYPNFDRADWVETRREPRDGFTWVWWERR